MTKQETIRAQHKRRADLVRKKLAEVKLAKGCIECGYKENAFALEFDHLPGVDKRATVASLCYQSWKTIEKEINKCEVVCANCHAIRTMTRKYLSGPIGGTYTQLP